MRVAYLFIDFGHDATVEQRQLATKSIASVRRHMPAAEIIHLTDMKTEPLDGVDCVWATEWAGKNRADLQSAVDGDTLFLDTDTIIMQDVSAVFKQSFDVAVAARPPDWDHKEAPFNQGVVFSRSPEFWRAVAKKARERRSYDEEGFSDVVLNGGFKVLELPVDFNFSVPPNLSILHFKGQRKKYMLAL